MALSISPVGAAYVPGFQTTPKPEKSTNPFLNLSDNQRVFWFEGAVRTAAALLALRNEAQGKCVDAWYRNDRDSTRRLLEEKIAAEGMGSETAVVLTAIQKACGPLIPKKAV